MTSSVAVYPKFRAVDPSTGLALVGGKLYTYAAGTTTPQATYSDSGLTTPNTNPIILDANGEAPIYVGALSYKFALQKSDGSAVWTLDNYAPNIASLASDGEWFGYGGTTQFVNPTTFKVTGADVSAILAAGRRIRSTNTAGTVYSTVKTASFVAPDTTIVVVNDGASALDSGFSALAYGMLSYSNPSYLDPRSRVFAKASAASQTLAATPTKLVFGTELIDTNSEFTGGTTFTAKYPGYYLAEVSATFLDSAIATYQLHIYTNGATYANVYQAAGASAYAAINVAAVLLLAAGDTIEFFAAGTATSGMRGGTPGSQISIARLP